MDGDYRYITERVCREIEMLNETLTADKKSESREVRKTTSWVVEKFFVTYSDEQLVAANSDWKTKANAERHAMIDTIRSMYFRSSLIS